MTLWDQMANEAGGELTEEEFFATAAAIASQPPRPGFLLTSMATIEEGRRQAEICCALALYAKREAERTRWWQWLRRRYLWRVFDDMAPNAEMLWRTFGTGE